MLNKTDVSLQITGLRPKVKQAAVHLAHHHTREIKKYEVRKGKKAEKFHRKAENLRKEVLLLKDLHPDKVTRYALMMNFQDSNKLLSDVNLPLKTKVLIKLATHASVMSHIAAFRLAHPEWESKLPHLLETLGIRAKFKKKIKKEQEKQKRKLARRQELSQDTNSDPSAKSNKDGDIEEANNVVSQVRKKPGIKTLSEELQTKASENDESGDTDESDSEKPSLKRQSFLQEEATNSEESGSIDMSDSENDDDDDDMDNDDNNTDDAEYIDEDSSQDEEQVISETEVDLGNGHEIPSNSNSCKTSKKISINDTNMKISSGSKFAVVRRFADLQKETQFEKEREHEETSSSMKNEELVASDVSENEPAEEDTFFMTEENRFLKTVAVKRGDGEGLVSVRKPAANLDLDAPQWVVDGKNLEGNRAQRRAKFLGKDPKIRKPKESKRPLDFRNSSAFSKLTKVEENNKNGIRSKKIFNDSGHSSGRREEKQLSKFKEKPFGNKNQISQQEASKIGESLHPSWEAKRKQKVSLDSFQGKKIKFDD